jgi:hypothetical protein
MGEIRLAQTRCEPVLRKTLPNREAGPLCGITSSKRRSRRTWDRHPVIRIFRHALAVRHERNLLGYGPRWHRRCLALEHANSVAGLTHLQGCCSGQKDNHHLGAVTYVQVAMANVGFPPASFDAPSRGWLFTSPGHLGASLKEFTAVSSTLPPKERVRRNPSR